MMTELKPCPFCGASEDNIDYGEYNGTLRGSYYVMCLECGAEITSTDMRGAFKAWNRREVEKKYINKLAIYLMHEAQAESSYASDDIKDWEKVAKMMMGEKDDT